MNQPPYHRFGTFIAPGADRFAVLSSLLEELDLNFSVVELAGRRHFFLFPGPVTGSGPPVLPPGRTVLVSHYDRTPGSPGANDNSAAVFQLVETALRLKTAMEGRPSTGLPCLIIFTDKEELSGDEGLEDQGAYTLARELRGLRNARVFIFDACGTGDTLIISTTADRLTKNEEGMTKTGQQIKLLRDQALKTAWELGMDRVLLLPTPFSDDAGFLRAGVPAQTITVLPGKEAAPFASLLRTKPALAETLISREGRRRGEARLIPETWRYLNSPADSPLRLTPRHYRRVVRFACALCGE